MEVLKEFDPWHSPLCTCPRKYVLNVYTGCYHRCLYCYASSYIRRFYQPRPKKDFLKRLRRDIEKVPPGLVMISASTDPYQPIEEKYQHTRRALEILLDRGFKAQIVTKGILFVRDKDLLESYSTSAEISVTITTLREEITRILEPFAPSPKERIKALKKIKIPKIVRIDPLIPYINYDEELIEEVLRAARHAGVSHIVFSTYKARPDSLKRISAAFPEIYEKIKKLYLSGERINNYLYLPSAKRREMLLTAMKLAQEYGFSVGFCREGIPFPARSCDGSHLILD